MTKGAKMLEKDIAKPTGGKMVPLYGGWWDCNPGSA